MKIKILQILRLIVITTFFSLLSMNLLASAQDNRGQISYIFKDSQGEIHEGKEEVAIEKTEFSPIEQKITPPIQTQATYPINFYLIQYNDKVAQLVNQERTVRGIAPMKISLPLTKASQDYAQLMVESTWFDHTGPDGSSPWDRMNSAGYTGWGYGENIARGNTTPESVVGGWMNSPGHRAILLESSTDEFGIGFYDQASAQYRYMWVLNSGIKRNSNQPNLTSISPSQGNAGTQVTLRGSGFGSTGKVYFGTAQSSTSNWTSTQITATSPALPRDVYVSVETLGGTSNALLFSLSQSPQITASKRASNDVVTVGAIFDYYITVKNTGLMQINNVIIEDTFNSRLEYVQGSGTGNPQIIGNKVKWIYPALPSGTQIDLGFAVKVLY